MGSCKQISFKNSVNCVFNKKCTVFNCVVCFGIEIDIYLKNPLRENSSVVRFLIRTSIQDPVMN